MLYMVTFTINIPQMLAYIPAPWILWAIINPIEIQVFSVDKNLPVPLSLTSPVRGDGAALCVSPKPGLHHGTLPALRLSEHRGTRWVPGLPGVLCQVYQVIYGSLWWFNHYKPWKTIGNSSKWWFNHYKWWFNGDFNGLTMGEPH